MGRMVFIGVINREWVIGGPAFAKSIPKRWKRLVANRRNPVGVDRDFLAGTQGRPRRSTLIVSPKLFTGGEESLSPPRSRL